MTVMEQLAKLEKQFSSEQAKVLMDVIENQTVTRDFLKSELHDLRADIHKEFAVFQRTMILWTAAIVFGGLVAHHLMR